MRLWQLSVCKLRAWQERTETSSDTSSVFQFDGIAAAMALAGTEQVGAALLTAMFPSNRIYKATCQIGYARAKDDRTAETCRKQLELERLLSLEECSDKPRHSYGMWFCMCELMLPDPIYHSSAQGPTLVISQPSSVAQSFTIEPKNPGGVK
eukprot:6361714-Amphidinium_carterae.1